MKTGIYNFTIQQGADFHLVISWATRENDVDTPVDITGYSARLQIKGINPNETVEWLSTGVSPVITVDAVNKEFIIDVPNADTATYIFTSGRYEFEAIAPSGKIYRLLKGSVILEKELVDE